MKRILLVADVRGWAWWWMAKGLQRCQPNGVEFTVFDQQQFAELTINRYVSGYDAILQFSWTEATLSGDDRPVHLPERNCTLLASHGAEFPYPIQDNESIPARIATSLRNRGRAMSSFKKFDRVLCVSERLKRVADQLTNNAALTLPGVDHAVFRPTPIPDRDRLVIGWCGQSAGVTKGYNEVLVPLMEANIPGVEFRVNDRSAQNPLSQEEMREWYHGIDVFLSTSCSEGFQMPPLEAMACGRPVIATDCGGIPHLVHGGVTGWILPSWGTVNESKAVLDALRGIIVGMSRTELRIRGASSRERVEELFTWEKRAPEWVKAILG